MLYLKPYKHILLNSSPTYYLSSRQLQPIIQNKVWSRSPFMANLNSKTTVDSVSTISLCDISSAIDDEFGRCISATARCCNNWHSSSTSSCSSTNRIPTPTSCACTKCGPSKGIL